MSSLELTTVMALPTPASLIRAFAFDSPASGLVSPADGFDLSGWVLGQSAPIVALTVTEANRPVTELTVDGRRNDVLAAHPDAPNALHSGFAGWVSTVALGPTFQLEIHARTADGTQAVLAIISGQRQRSAATPTARPRPVPARPMPEFFIVGSQRGGTRSLFEYLAAHSDVERATNPEVHFFDLYFDRGTDWYLNQFPDRTAHPGQITGEASPYYLFHPLAANRLHAIAPEAKIIVLLRNPVERAFSHYQLEEAQGNEPLTFEEALEAEEERLAGEEARLIDDDTYRSFAHQHYSYQARGDYVPQLRRWLDRFPQEQILIARSEDLFADPAELFARVTGFLGLPAAPLTSPRIYNRSRATEMRAETRDMLEARFARQATALERLLGAPFGWDD